MINLSWKFVLKECKDYDFNSKSILLQTSLTLLHVKNSNGYWFSVQYASRLHNRMKIFHLMLIIFHDADENIWKFYCSENDAAFDWSNQQKRDCRLVIAKIIANYFVQFYNFSNWRPTIESDMNHISLVWNFEYKWNPIIE